MKGKFDAYALRPLAKGNQNWIVDRSTVHDFMVGESTYLFYSFSEDIVTVDICKKEVLTLDSGDS